jgi:hypothetical protein
MYLPDDPGDNDQDAKNFDADAYEMNPLARNRLEGGIAGSHASLSTDRPNRRNGSAL